MTSISEPAGGAARIRDRALALGFDAVGVARADAVAGAGERLAAFVAAGWHGDMGWLAATLDRRRSPRALWPAARSAVMVALSYAPPGDPLAALADRRAGALSVHARNRDYHRVLKGRLKTLAGWVAARLGGEVKVFVDTAPLLEKPLAAAAGLGWQGKHTNLVSPVSRFVAVPRRAAQHAGTGAGGTGGGPLRALPPLPRHLPDRRLPRPLPARCAALHFLSDHRAQGTHPARAAGGDGQPHLWLRRLPGGVPMEQIRAGDGRTRLRGPRLAVSAAARRIVGARRRRFRALFSASPVKRIGRDRFVRNVLIAIGNSGDAALAPCAGARLEDASPLVRAAAVWALSRLLTPAAFAALRARRAPREANAEVAAEWAEAA